MFFVTILFLLCVFCNYIISSVFCNYIISSVFCNYIISSVFCNYIISSVCFLFICLTSHILHTSLVRKVASLIDEGNSAYFQSSGAHNIKHKHMELTQRRD